MDEPPVHSRPLEGSLPLKLPGQHPSWGRRPHVGWRSGRGGAGLAELRPHLGRSSQEEGAGAPCCSPGGKQAGPETRASRLLPALSRLGVCSEGLWGEGV